MLCLCVILFLTVIACGTDHKNASKAGVKISDIPVRYRKELEYLKFDIDHIETGTSEDLYQSYAERVEFNPKVLTQYFLGEGFQEEIHKDKNGIIYLIHKNHSFLLKQDYVAYRFGSELQVYVTENIPAWRNSKDIDAISIYTDFSEASLQSEKEILEEQFSKLGVENLVFQKCYDQDECTYWMGLQEWQGMPVFTTIFYEGMNEEWMPVQVLNTSGGAELASILYCFRFEQKKEKIELLPFDEIAKSLEQEYAMILTDKKHDVVGAELYFWIDVNQEESEYKMEPVWIFTLHEYREGKEEDYREYQEMIHAETGRCVEVRG